MSVDVAGFMQHKSIINNFIYFAQEIVKKMKMEEDKQFYRRIFFRNKETKQLELNHKLLYERSIEREKVANQDYPKVKIEYKRVSDFPMEKSSLMQFLLRIFYWGAYYGHLDFIRDYMVLIMRISPFMKSFNKQSVLSAAIRGERVSVVRMLTKFKYYTEERDESGFIVDQQPLLQFNKDIDK